MSQDSDDDENLFDSPAKPLDLKPCSVFLLPAVDTRNLSKGWRCRHCGGSCAKRNQTKVTAHLSNIAGGSIATCDFNLTMLSKAEGAACAFCGSLLIAGRNSRALKAKVIDNHLSDRHDAVVCAADVRKGTSAVQPQSNLFDDDEEVPGLHKRAFSVDKPGYPLRSSPTESITSFATASTSRKKRNISTVSCWPAFQRAGFVPLAVGTKQRMSPPTFEPSQQKKADQECTRLAGQWVAATGQDFNILEDLLTKKFLESCKHTSKNYKLPSRKQLSGDLLDINYEVQEAASLKALKNGADLGGNQFCSDFATIGGRACLDILGSGPHVQAVVLDIVDCHEHLADGGIKDGKFVYKKTQPWVEKI